MAANGAPSADERADDRAEKHVHYEDQPESASDEDTKPFEVTFESNNPHRRKSSLAAATAVMPQIPTTTKKTQCLVHQFLESHRPPSDSEKPHFPHHAKNNRQAPGRDTEPQDATADLGLNRYVEPKGTNKGPSSLHREGSESSSMDEAGGQIDQSSWKNELAKSRSELDLAASKNHDGLHSRLLTKKQLSEMAWGVRELSRRLGSMRLKFKVRTVFILTKLYDQELLHKTRELARWLLSKDRDVRYTVYVEHSVKGNKKFDMSGLLDELRREYIEAGEMDEDTPRDVLDRRLRFWTEDMCRTRPHMFDFVLSLGGDGTVLYASWLFQRIVPPVLSFALGSLGFLTKFDFSDYEDILTTSFTQGVTVSLRLRFEGTVMRSQAKRKAVEAGNNSGASNGNVGSASSHDDDDDEDGHVKRDLVEELIGEEKDDEHTHKPDGTYEILNEIVVDRGPNATMSYTEIFGDDEHFTSVLADGVCVSTPTGSTAYNLAAGGSLCHPENPVMLVTSICPHTLSFRPIILPDTIVLRIGVPYDARTNSWASFDGRERIELKPGDYVTISASRFPFATVQPHGRRSEDWINSISGKLGWNTRQKQKNEGFAKWDS
ncbi:ATP-NAD kinase [Microdochium trichocladiopsis]|uniref:ATP-NAD kinase n=1 Tax=Microdochium trichocladiopsis TaxID=1682393 RepID=A0A9P9BVD5_9PEZI|nr:ATP-NAD kinase [Microdochium trichocladiopsis]KAH7033237.1 ATP-NAD kinase [Microdochium trichocladiopsis]